MLIAATTVSVPSRIGTATALVPGITPVGAKVYPCARHAFTAAITSAAERPAVFSRFSLRTVISCASSGDIPASKTMPDTLAPSGRLAPTLIDSTWIGCDPRERAMLTESAPCRTLRNTVSPTSAASAVR